MKTIRNSVLLVVVLAGTLGTPFAHAGAGIVNEQVAGEVLTAQVRIDGNDLADLRIEFEEVDGLTVGALGLSAEMLDPVSLSAVALRLPDAIQVAIPDELPLQITIDPISGITLRGVVHLTVTTDLLPYTPGTRLRLFHASQLETFEDVTAETSAGSYRVGSARPDLNSPFASSSFVIAYDLRSDEVGAAEKLDRLDDLLELHSGEIDPQVLAELEGTAADVRAAFEADDVKGAEEALELFAAAVAAFSGNGIPDVWAAQGTAANVAGELRAQAATLRYSLLQLGG